MGRHTKGPTPDQIGDDGDVIAVAEAPAPAESTQVASASPAVAPVREVAVVGVSRHGRPEGGAATGASPVAAPAAAPAPPSAPTDVSAPPQVGKRRRAEPEPDISEPIAADRQTSQRYVTEHHVAEQRATPPGGTVPTAPVSDDDAVTPTVIAPPIASPTVVERDASSAPARGRLLMIVGALAAVLVLAIGIGYVLLRGGGAPDTGPITAAPARQTTLLVQVTGKDGTAAASVLTGVTAKPDTGAALLVPSPLLVSSAGSGDVPFGETASLPVLTAPAEALTDLLGVRVENEWKLTQAGLAALVDKVGGVQVTVDVDVTAKDAKGNQVVVVPKGAQKLSGQQAAAYATFLAEDEADSARLARFNDVFDRVLRSLPATGDRIAPLLPSATAGSASTMKRAQLAAYLAGLRASAVKDKLRYDVLPVNDIDTGASETTYGLNSADAAPLLDDMFAPSILKDPAGQSVRVLVENGVGTPDLVTKARAKLVAKGFRFINGGNASEFSASEPTTVLIADGSDKNVARGSRVAAALGVPESAVELNPRGQTVADVIVILGADFAP